MAKIDKTYHKLLKHILNEGYKYEDPNRKGIFRREVVDYKIVHDFKDGFPAITTKKLYWKGVVGELLTFLSGSTELKDLRNNFVNFWDKDAYNYYLRQNPEGTKKSFEEGINKHNHIAGDLGRIYSHQMRNWEGQFDQIKNLIQNLKTNPLGTKKTVTMWNPLDLEDSCLSPCHWSFEILVEPLSDKEVSKNSLNLAIKRAKTETVDIYKAIRDTPKYTFTLKWHQHSCDVFLGIPMNIAYYALLAQIIGKMTNIVPKGIIGDLSNVHIYEPHLDAIKKQLSRNVNKYDKCELEINSEINNILSGKVRNTTIDLDTILTNIGIPDFELKNYKSYSRISAEMLAYNK